MHLQKYNFFRFAFSIILNLDLHLRTMFNKAFSLRSLLKLSILTVPLFLQQ